MDPPYDEGSSISYSKIRFLYYSIKRAREVEDNNVIAKREMGRKGKYTYIAILS